MIESDAQSRPPKLRPVEAAQSVFVKQKFRSSLSTGKLTKKLPRFFVSVERNR